MPNKPNGEGKNARKSQGVALIRNRGPARFPWLVVRSLLFFQVTRVSSRFFSAAHKLTLLHISVQYGEIFTENLVLLALCVRGTQPCVRPHKWLNSEYFLLYSQVQQRQLFLCVPYQKKREIHASRKTKVGVPLQRKAANPQVTSWRLYSWHGCDLFLHATTTYNI